MFTYKKRKCILFSISTDGHFDTFINDPLKLRKLTHKFLAISHSDPAYMLLLK